MKCAPHFSSLFGSIPQLAPSVAERNRRFVKELHVFLPDPLRQQPVTCAFMLDRSDFFLSSQISSDSNYGTVRLSLAAPYGASSAKLFGFS